MYESKLNHVDKILEVKIREVRKAVADGTYNTQPKEQVANDAKNTTHQTQNNDRPGYFDDASSRKGSASIHSRRNSNGFVSDKLSRAGSSVIGGGNYQGSIVHSMGEKKLVYEDPTAALNITERRWNDMVIENKRKFEEENARKEEVRKLKNK